MATSGMLSFSVLDAKDALSDILESFRDPENVRRLEEAKENAGNDMMKSMQLVFPLYSQIQMGTIHKYGFPDDGEGLIQFTQAIKSYEQQDTHVADLNTELRRIVMPRMEALPPSSNVTV